ncbi:Ig-like domain-containing protein [Ascidiimonas aurantiaca]|uniref:Ig-like domain-containing protein n=1 Tax=Ascidiimonas aurantiaca TaxID=1685432 RepID=UPI0030EECDD8
MKKLVFKTVVCVIILATIVNCARRGSPSGGEKDMTPPVLLKASPELNSTNFNTKKIRLSFDEFVKIKDLQKQLIISPPPNTIPEIRPQGSASKKIEIIIKDSLYPNTTYVFNFGQSIVDNNEENPLPFFKYVFSTGNEIDSLSVSGNITDALNRKSENFVSVMLYEVDSTFTDSIIYTKTPKYITNTLDSLTAFELSNLREGTYMLVALKDIGKNNLFDQKTDKIAFLEEFITVPTDSVYTLKLFKEVTNYAIYKPIHAAKNRIIFGYEGMGEFMDIQMLTQVPEDYTYRTLKDPVKDTINYWFTPFEADSLVFRVVNNEFTDTLSVKMKDLYADSLTISPVTRELSFTKPFTLSANIPLAATNQEKITLMDGDSTAIAFTTSLDTLKNTISVSWDTEPQKRYLMQLFPGALTDMFGNVNDTLNYPLTTKSFADLGTINLKLRNVTSYPILIQLTNDKGEVTVEKYVEAPKESHEFRYLDPGEYFIRVIFDTNKNGKWDTGNYLLKQQPERISYFPGAVELRANWELQQTFTLE